MDIYLRGTICWLWVSRSCSASVQTFQTLVSGNIPASFIFIINLELINVRRGLLFCSGVGTMFYIFIIAVGTGNMLLVTREVIPQPRPAAVVECTDSGEGLQVVGAYSGQLTGSWGFTGGGLFYW